MPPKSKLFAKFAPKVDARKAQSPSRDESAPPVSSLQQARQDTLDHNRENQSAIEERERQERAQARRNAEKTRATAAARRDKTTTSGVDVPTSSELMKAGGESGGAAGAPGSSGGVMVPGCSNEIAPVEISAVVSARRIEEQQQTERERVIAAAAYDGVVVEQETAGAVVGVEFLRESETEEQQQRRINTEFFLNNTRSELHPALTGDVVVSSADGDAGEDVDAATKKDNRDGEEEEGEDGDQKIKTKDEGGDNEAPPNAKDSYRPQLYWAQLPAVRNPYAAGSGESPPASPVARSPAGPGGFPAGPVSAAAAMASASPGSPAGAGAGPGGVEAAVSPIHNIQTSGRVGTMRVHKSGKVTIAFDYVGGMNNATAQKYEVDLQAPGTGMRQELHCVRPVHGLDGGSSNSNSAAAKDRSIPSLQTFNFGPLGRKFILTPELNERTLDP